MNEKSKAPLGMLEQMVMLLVFALAAALCLQAFVKSDAASRESEARDRAANLCQSMAEVMRTGVYPAYAADLVLGEYQCDTNMILIPLNEDMTPYMDSGFPYEGAAYQLEILAPAHRALGLEGAEIIVSTFDGEVLFSLEVLWQVEVTA